jgi:mRNA interferase RelE/StbE
VAEYTLTIARQAARDLESLPAAVVVRVDRKILALRNDPRPVHGKKLKGPLDLWRIRVGDYRVIYSIDDRARLVDIVRIRHRSKAYD